MSYGLRLGVDKTPDAQYGLSLRPQQMQQAYALNPISQPQYIGLMPNEPNRIAGYDGHQATSANLRSGMIQPRQRKVNDPLKAIVDALLNQ